MEDVQFMIKGGYTYKTQMLWHIEEMSQMQ